MSQREGPWQPHEVMPLVDFSVRAPWHGGNEPQPIGPNVNPGALVAVLLDEGGREHRRWLLTSADLPAGLDEAAAAVAAGVAMRIIIFDGDHGKAVLALTGGRDRD